MGIGADELRGIAQRMIAIRGDRSQRAFATRIGVAPSSYYRHERLEGGMAPSVTTLLALWEVEGVNLHWLLTGQGPSRWRDPMPELTTRNGHHEPEGELH